MDVICLNIKSANRPGVGFTDAADFLFHKYRKLTNETW